LLNSKKKAAVALGVAALMGGALVPAAAQDAGPGDERVMTFYNPALEQMLDSNGSGDTPLTWVPNGGDYQKWRLHPLDDPRTVLMEALAKPGQCLQAPVRPGVQILSRPCNRFNPDQHWTAEKFGDQVYVGQVDAPDRVVTATEHNGAVTVDWREDSPLQRWIVSELD
jgi:hypothetical protein